MSERFVNPKIAAMPPSGIRKFFNLAGTMKGAISLGVGEPDFTTPYHVREALIDSLLNEETQYTENRGLLALRREISFYLKNRFHIAYDAETEILVTVGASEAIDITLRATLRPGDEVLLPDPGYVSYAPCVEMSGGIAVPVQTRVEDEFQVTAEALEKKVTPRTRALLLSYPNNPTGAILSDDYLRQVAIFAQKHDLLVICDEIYNELVYDNKHQTSVASLPGMWERTVTINGFSKAFAMTGLRIGYMCAPQAILDAAVKIHQYTIMCASRSSQVAAIQALKAGRENDYADIIQMRDSYNQRRRLMLHAFAEMGISCFEPKGAFYLFPCIRSTGLSSDDFCTRLLQEQAVVCVPGTAFGASGEGFIRCCYATDKNKLMESFRRIRSFLATLQEENREEVVS